MKFPSSETVSVSPMSKLVNGRRKGCQELYSIISLLSKSLKAARGGEGGLEDQSSRIPLSKLWSRRSISCSNLFPSSFWEAYIVKRHNTVHERTDRRFDLWSSEWQPIVLGESNKGRHTSLGRAKCGCGTLADSLNNLHRFTRVRWTATNWSREDITSFI